MRVRVVRVAGSLVLALGLLAWAGCGSRDTGGPKEGEKGPGKDGGHGHSHERGKMLIADLGTKYHALLTAHLSAKEGNELDIYFETADEDEPTPLALPLESFTAQARTADGELKDLDFRCAPASERPKGEKAGTCSHFVARAPWMKAGDRLYVVVKVQVDGKELTARWKNFNPKKYAHHED